MLLCFPFTRTSCCWVISGTDFPTPASSFREDLSWQIKAAHSEVKSSRPSVYLAKKTKRKGHDRRSCVSHNRLIKISAYRNIVQAMRVVGQKVRFLTELKRTWKHNKESRIVQQTRLYQNFSLFFPHRQTSRTLWDFKSLVFVCVFVFVFKLHQQLDRFRNYALWD